MSNVGNFDRIYVGDLDDYLDLNAIDSDNAREARVKELTRQNEELGPVKLLASLSLSHRRFEHHKLNIAEWSFELYRARRYLRDLRSWRALEPLLVRQLLSAGRTYAIRRYAKQEKIAVPAAITAALPYGIQALMSQFLSQQGLLLSSGHSRQLSAAWKSVAAMEDLSAYGKTGRIRDEIFAIAEQTWGRHGYTNLQRDEMRQILSLTRLHFSVVEMNNGGFARFTKLESIYDAERRQCLENEKSPTFSGIRHWQQRHLRPLLFYYPFALRQAVARGRRQAEAGEEPDLPERVANEVALAHCALARIGRRSVR